MKPGRINFAATNIIVEIKAFKSLNSFFKRVLTAEENRIWVNQMRY